MVTLRPVSSLAQRATRPQTQNPNAPSTSRRAALAAKWSGRNERHEGGTVSILRAASTIAVPSCSWVYYRQSWTRRELGKMEW